jgi:formiminotetrahydrofolate cyclodeaminase
MDGTLTSLRVGLDDMAAEPVPGSLAAAAVGAAMGAALVAKAMRVTLQRQALNTIAQTELGATLRHADAVRTELMPLVASDQEAVRAVLQLSHATAGDPAANQAWRAATELPVQVAELCQALSARLAHQEEIIWPAVRAELQTGIWLLKVGVRAGQLAAEVNLRNWGCNADSQPIQSRIDALKQEIEVEDWT